MFSGAKALLGGMVMILFGFAYMADPELGTYTSVAFIGVGILLLVVGAVLLLGWPQSLRAGTIKQPILKTVCCGQCSSYYAYQVEVDHPVNGMSTLFLQGEALQEALNARARFEAKCEKLVAAVPCPTCGWYQVNMLPLVRKAYIHWTATLGWVSLACSGVVLTIRFDARWVVAMLFAVAGASLIGVGVWRRQRFEPNASDPQRRRQLGQSLALWGDRFERAVAENRPFRTTPEKT